MAAQLPHNPKPFQLRGAEALRMARRVNRAWITRGKIAETTENYLEHLQKFRSWEIEGLCERALKEARLASREQKDRRIQSLRSMPRFFQAQQSRSGTTS